MRTLRILALFAALTCAGATRATSLQQNWGAALDTAHSRSHDTPVTRVTNLLKEMSKTLAKEMDEDKALYKELMCWCNSNGYMKGEEIKAAEAKATELTATIEELTAKTADLANTIKETESELAANKESLKGATAQRKKEISDFQKMETDSLQALENLKAAITVLAKHQESAFPQLSTSFLQTRKWFRGSAELRSLDELMQHDGFNSEDAETPAVDVAAPAEPAATGLVQQTEQAPAADADWSRGELATVRRALRQGNAFMQTKHKDTYSPSYNAQSGEITGVLKQMQEEMTTDLKEAQQEEADRAANFEELRKAKESEIASGEKMAETKEDEKATTDNDLAEAKEDLKEIQKALEKAAKFAKTLKETCGDATKNFEEREGARMEEMKAVSETIEILQEDDARDAMTGTFSFVQVSTRSRRASLRSRATALLRRAAARSQSSELANLATSVQLDAFTKVKESIDGMISALKTEQADEVKKNDWCKAELQENEMTTAKTDDRKEDLTAAIAQLKDKQTGLAKEIATEKASIASMYSNLQKASVDRKKENFEFQTTIADQQMTIEVLKKALDKLATFYDAASLVQVSSRRSRQPDAPPVAQMEYKKSSGASGVMQMIEKLIEDAKEIQTDSKKSESDAQLAYEELIANTNDNVAALQEGIVTKSKAMGKARKDRRLKKSDLGDTMKELEGLAKTLADLHTECDYVLKNFDVRQKARGEEIEALQQAKQILNGADLS